MESSHSHRDLALSPSNGFTLIELLVVLAIIIVITAITLTGQSSFNRTLILSNTAYDIALTLRSAETYGLGVRGSNAETFGQPGGNAGYGVDFQAALPTAFILFVDSYPAASTSSCHPTSDASVPNAQPGNCAYDANAGEKISLYTLGNQITVSSFCAKAAGAWSCSTNSLSSLDIVFSRPNARPFISTNGVYSALVPISDSCITVSAPDGTSRYVSVNAVGLINAAASACPTLP